MIDLWRELQRYLTVATKTSYSSDQAERPVVLTFTVANSASPPSPNSPEIVFEEVKLHIRTESDGEVVKELGRLEPQQSVAAEHQVSYRDLVQLTHRAVGRVSPETFLTVVSEGTPRQDDVNMPVEGYLTVLEETNLSLFTLLTQVLFTEMDHPQHPRASSYMVLPSSDNCPWPNLV